MASRPRVYPVSLLLAERPCLVVGGGLAAYQRTEGLLGVGALVTVIAPAVTAELAALAVTLERRRFRAGDTKGFAFVVAATGDAELDAAVHADARSNGVLVNAVDNPASSDCYLPAVLRRGDISVAISSAGSSPALASWLRDRVGELLGEEFELVAELVAEARADVRASGRSSEGLEWTGLIEGLVELLGSGGSRDAARLLAESWCRDTLGELDGPTETVRPDREPTDE